MRNMSKECREWSGELVDDTLKEMFMAVERYRFHGSGNTAHNAGMAVARLKKQLYERLPLIELRAEEACQPQKPCIDDSGLKQDIGRLAKAMEEKKPYVQVHAMAMAIDRKYALPAYEQFCACGVR